MAVAEQIFDGAPCPNSGKSLRPSDVSEDGGARVEMCEYYLGDGRRCHLGEGCLLNDLAVIQRRGSVVRGSDWEK